MRKLFALIVAAAAIMVAVGCSSVSTPYPVGAALPADQLAAFEGAWQHDDQIVYVHHAPDNHTILAGVEWDSQASRYVLRQHRAVFGQVGQHVTLSLISEDDPGRYFFTLVRLMDDGQLMVCGPNVPAFAQAVEAGRLAGTVQRDGHDAIEVRVTAAKADFDAFLVDQPAEALFHLDKPARLTRVIKAP